MSNLIRAALIAFGICMPTCFASADIWVIHRLTLAPLPASIGNGNLPVSLTHAAGESVELSAQSPLDRIDKCRDRVWAKGFRQESNLASRRIMTKVRPLTKLFLVSSGSVWLMLGQYRPPNNRVSARFGLSIHFDHDRVTVGEPVKVSATLKNVSRAAAGFSKSKDEWDYEFIVRDAHGRVPALTEYGKRLAAAERGGSRISRTLDPGAEVHKDFDLGKVFIFAPGRYCVRALRIVGSEDGATPTRAVSNAACFDVSR